MLRIPFLKGKVQDLNAAACDDANGNFGPFRKRELSDQEDIKRYAQFRSHLASHWDAAPGQRHKKGVLKGSKSSESLSEAFAGIGSIQEG